MKIKWHKNDNGDYRGLTIDAEGKQALNVELKRIRELFMTKQDLESSEIRLAYAVSFLMNKRP